MASTILFKFRSGTTFEALPLPGSAARLLDVKKAIVAAKKLDQGSMDFDLSVKDAASGADYADDAMILPRGTRLIVQRLPAARGQGILATIARGQYGGGGGGGGGAPQGAAAHDPSGGVPSNYYTIESRGRDEDEEFISATPAPSSEENELAALRAATESASNASGGAGIILRGGVHGGGGGGPGGGGGFRPNQPAGSGPPPPTRGGGAAGGHNFQPPRAHSARPNADPELRDQELQPKKRATGIPRTFLNLSAHLAPDGAEGGGVGMPLLQPNTIGFEELVNRGGGQSENAVGTRRDLDYAIKLTATTIPEYLQCAICHSVVRDAMMLPWDPEGRTTCEQCIRNALTESSFRCPLTQQEGVSPDDLLPNHALRKAAVQFVKDVMEKIAEIDKQAAVEEEISEEIDGDTMSKVLESDLTDKGVILTRRATAAEMRKKQEEDPFGSVEDAFGGDIFAVEADNPEVGDADDAKPSEAAVVASTANVKVEESALQISENADVRAASADLKVKVEESAPAMSASKIEASPNKQLIVKTEQAPDSRASQASDDVHNSARRNANRRRGPPVGYTMGPAGGATVGHAETSRAYSPHGEVRPEPSVEGGSRDRPYRGSGGYRGVGGQSYGGRHDSNDAPGGGRANGYQDSHPRNDVSTVALALLCIYRARVCLHCSPTTIEVRSKAR